MQCQPFPLDSYEPALCRRGDLLGLTAVPAWAYLRHASNKFPPRDNPTHWAYRLRLLHPISTLAGRIFSLEAYLIYQE